MTLPLNDYDCACFDVSPLVRTRKSIKTFAIFFSLDIIHRLNVIKSKLKLTFKKLKIKKPDRGRKPNVENIIGRQWMNISVSSGCVCVRGLYLFFYDYNFLFLNYFHLVFCFKKGSRWSRSRQAEQAVVTVIAHHHLISSYYCGKNGERKKKIDKKKKFPNFSKNVSFFLFPPKNKKNR